MSDLETARAIESQDPFAIAQDQAETLDSELYFDIMGAFGASEISPLYKEFVK